MNEEIFFQDMPEINKINDPGARFRGPFFSLPHSLSVLPSLSLRSFFPSFHPPSRFSDVVFWGRGEEGRGKRGEMNSNAACYVCIHRSYLFIFQRGGTDFIEQINRVF